MIVRSGKILEAVRYQEGILRARPGSRPAEIGEDALEAVLEAER